VTGFVPDSSVRDASSARANYCSTCFHYSPMSDWNVSDAGTASALEQCPCCQVWRNPAGVLSAPFVYTAHSFGPLETEDERDAAADERRRLSPVEGQGVALVAPTATGAPLRMRHEHSASPIFSLSPVAAAVAARAETRRAPTGYASPRSSARWVLGLLGVTIATNMLSLLALGAQRSLLDRGVGQIALSEWHTSVSRVNNLAIFELILYVVTVVAFFMWLHRCYVNAALLGVRGLRFTPGWAVGYWFIPVLNIVRSKQILDELWRVTAPPNRLNAGEKERTSLTLVWMCALIAAWALSRTAAVVNGGSIDNLKHINGLLFASHLGELTAAALIYRLVSALTARQELGIDANGA
jgi:hypothetical protein